MNIPSIETKRLRLRPFFPTDFEPFAEMLADPQVVSFLGDGKARDRTEAWFSFAGESFEREIDFKGKRLFVYGRDRPY